jgi:hypothetical protein
MPLSEGLFAALADPAAIERERTRFPSQKGIEQPSNFSQSDLRAENRCFSAERKQAGPLGISLRPSAQPHPALRPRPTAKPLSRSVRRKAASLAETRRETSSIPQDDGAGPQQLMRPSRAGAR